MNFKDLGAGYVDRAINDWRPHPTDKSVDVAVVPFGFGEGIDHMVYPTKSFATDEIIEQERIGIGEEVFLPGLFVHHFGEKRNIPILRVGNIAAMPEEPVNTTWSSNMEAYLIEARSIGGLSGSPVFVHLGLVRIMEGEGQSELATKSLGGPFYLLGLMHGHWDSPITERDSILNGEPSTESVNMGIGIVVPAKKILEVINQPELEEMRKRKTAEWKAQSAATLDSPIAGNGGKKAFTRDDFMRDLNKVVKKKSDKDAPKSDAGNSQT